MNIPTKALPTYVSHNPLKLQFLPSRGIISIGWGEEGKAQGSGQGCIGWGEEGKAQGSGQGCIGWGEEGKAQGSGQRCIGWGEEGKAHGSGQGCMRSTVQCNHDFRR